MKFRQHTEMIEKVLSKGKDFFINFHNKDILTITFGIEKVVLFLLIYLRLFYCSCKGLNLHCLMTGKNGMHG